MKLCVFFVAYFYLLSIFEILLLFDPIKCPAPVARRVKQIKRTSDAPSSNRCILGGEGGVVNTDRTVFTGTGDTEWTGYT